MFKYDKTPVIPFSEQRMMRVKDIIASLAEPITTEEKMKVRKALEAFEKDIKELQRHYYDLFTSELQFKIDNKRAKERLDKSAIEFFSLADYQIREKVQKLFQTFKDEPIKVKTDFFTAEKAEEVPKFTELKENPVFQLFFPKDIPSDSFFNHLVCNRDLAPMGKPASEYFPTYINQCYNDKDLKNVLGAAAQTIYVVAVLESLLGADQAKKVIENNLKAPELYLKKRAEKMYTPRCVRGYRGNTKFNFDRDVCGKDYSSMIYANPREYDALSFEPKTPLRPRRARDVDIAEE